MKAVSMRLAGWAAAALWLTAAARAEEPQYRGWVRGKDLAWAPMTAATNTALRYHALVIGINDYQKAPPLGWDKLGTARQDAEAVADVLEKQYGFKVTRILDQQATRATILAALDNLSNYTIDDAVLVYYAGHGYFDAALGEGFWIPVDAGRKSGSRSANQDWVWNSVITKIIGASPARHVLVVSDSCYGGSLFRGAADTLSDPTWYVRALTTPSRYLITSGDLEPVLDSGGQHSIFCQSLLNILQYPAKPVFSASDVGVALREKVSTLTAQMPRMGPLSVASHAGGEFVFQAKGAPPLTGAAVAGAGGATRGDSGASALAPEERPAPPTDQDLLRDAALLARQGATNACRDLLGLVSSEAKGGGVAQAVMAYVDQQRQRERRGELQNLIERLEKRKQEGALPGATESASARPRIIACLGPDTTLATADGEGEALLYRLCLRSALEQDGRAIVVERDALETILQELELGTSDLADPRAKTAIGKLLPASLLVMGDVLKRGEAATVFLRLIDTETTRVLGTFTASVPAGGDVAEACDKLGREVMAKSVRVKPLEAAVTKRDGDTIEIAMGRFHGGVEDMSLQIAARGDTAGAETIVGTATVTSAGEETSTCKVEWSGEPPKADLRARETTP